MTLPETPHYQSRGGIEPLHFIGSNRMEFWEGCVIKYIYRAPFKGNEIDDLRKAHVYLTQGIQEAMRRSGDMGSMIRCECGTPMVNIGTGLYRCPHCNPIEAPNATP